MPGIFMRCSQGKVRKVHHMSGCRARSIDLRDEIQHRDRVCDAEEEEIDYF